MSISCSGSEYAVNRRTLAQSCESARDEMMKSKGDGLRMEESAPFFFTSAGFSKLMSGRKEKDEQFLQVGVISSTHGIRGEVKVFPTTDDAARFKKLKKGAAGYGEGAA